MDSVVSVLSNAVVTSALLLIVAFLARNLVVERLKLSLQKEYSRFLDEMQWNRKVQEQAARAAEYLALARRLKASSSEDDYERANRLSWELAMWLPEEVYKQMVLAIVHPNKDANELSVTVSVRKLLLGTTAGNLSKDDIAHHAPGIGSNTAAQNR